MNKRGRPPGTTKPFLSDPDRFPVAFADTLKAAGISERKAFDLSTAVFFGRHVEPTKISTRMQPREGWELVGYETITTTVDGKSTTLRKKASRGISERDLNWRAALSSAFFLALFRQDLPFATLRDSIRALCSSADEPHFADALLRMMIAPRNLPAELFSEVHAARNVIDGKPTLQLSDGRKP